MTYQYWPEIFTYLKFIEDEQNELRGKQLNQEGANAFRKKAQKHLESLKYSLSKRLAADMHTHAYLAITAAIDEDMRLLAESTGKFKWTSLQTEGNVGEIFYRAIDKTLDDPQTPSIVFEIFYFLLKRGYKGRHSESKTQIQKYLELLKDKIRALDPSQQQTTEEDTDKIKKPFLKKAQIYAVGAAVIAIVFTTLIIKAKGII